MGGANVRSMLANADSKPFKSRCTVTSTEASRSTTKRRSLLGRDASSIVTTVKSSTCTALNRVSAKVRLKNRSANASAVAAVGLLAKARPRAPNALAWYRVPASTPKPSVAPMCESRLRMTCNSCAMVTMEAGSSRLSVRTPVPDKQLADFSPYASPRLTSMVNPKILRHPTMGSVEGFCINGMSLNMDYLSCRNISHPPRKPYPSCTNDSTTTRRCCTR